MIPPRTAPIVICGPGFPIPQPWPLAVVQIDHTPVDLIVVDEQHRRTCPRVATSPLVNVVQLEPRAWSSANRHFYEEDQRVHGHSQRLHGPCACHQRYCPTGHMLIVLLMGSDRTIAPLPSAVLTKYLCK
jgi:hypothetical protein